MTNVESVCNYGCCTTIPVENIRENEWILELEDIEKDSGKVIEKKHKTHRKVNGVRHKFKECDILYSKLRTYLNKVLLANAKGYCTTEIIPISCYDCIDQQYLYHWLRSPFFLDYTRSCGYGVKMPRLSTTDARNGIVPLPPIKEQKRIVGAINRLFLMLNDIMESLS